MQREHFFLVASGILSGFIVFSGKVFSDMGLSLFEISFLLYVFVIPLLLPFIIFRRESAFKKEMLPYWLLFSIATTLTVLCQFGAVVLGVPVAIVVLLLYTQPLWTTLFSKFALKEKVGKIQAIACALVIIGTVFVANPFDAALYNNWFGLLVALAGGICLSFWVIAGSIAGKKKADPLATTFFELFFMIIFLLILYPILGFFTSDPKIVGFSLNWPLQIWGLILLYTIFAEIINHMCYIKGTQKVSTANAGIIMLLEPVSGAILATIFLSQPLTITTIAGGTLILVANYLVIRHGNKK